MVCDGPTCPCSCPCHCRKLCSGCSPLFIAASSDPDASSVVVDPVCFKSAAVQGRDQMPGKLDRSVALVAYAINVKVTASEGRHEVPKNMSWSDL
eukprot:4942248-Amphidinium_carterae.1